MKAWFPLNAFLLCLAWASLPLTHLANAGNPDEAEIVKIDPKGLKFSVTQNGQVRVYSVGHFVDTTINGQKAKFEELEPGLKVKVTAAADGVATRIVADGIRTQQPAGKAPIGAGAVVRELKASVSGNPLEGFVIGDIRKGTTLSFKYVSGKWKSPAKDMSPDETTSAATDKLAVALPPESGKPGQTLAILPAGTAKKPFLFVADRDFPGLVLRINSDQLTGNHGGTVEYAAKVLPPTR